MSDSKIKELENRIEKLERIENKRKKEELSWAVNQFKYMEKTSEQSKALSIIERELGLRKTPLRCKNI